MVATRAPGLEPENIRIELQGLRLSVAGTPRGLGQVRKPGYVQREWSVGPYQRTVDLPSPVDSTRANASYDNGVLVLIFPLFLAADLGHHGAGKSRYGEGAAYPPCRKGPAAKMKVIAAVARTLQRSR